MSEATERAARAMYESECPDNRQRYDVSADKMVPASWDEYEWKEIYRRRARVALEAAA